VSAAHPGFVITLADVRPGRQQTQTPAHVSPPITRQAIRRGSFRSVRELTDAHGAFIDAYNDRCQPFTWTKDAGQLLAKINPGRQRPNAAPDPTRASSLIG
jgi:hypothetical protein